MGGLLCATALFAALGSDRADADVYRCTRPDGSVVFSDDPTACPGSDPHEPAGVVQSIPAAAPSHARPLRGAAASAVRDEGATAWRQKRENTERELAALTQKQAYLEEYVTHCNRGRRILRENENGMRYGVSCENIRREYADLKEALARARAYLDGGLEEECRRAGCLPGWIR